MHSRPPLPRWLRAGAVALLLTLAARPVALRAQTGAVAATPPAIRIALGFDVDSTRSPDREILARWTAYLRHAHADTTRPHPFWSRAEQARWPVFDLVSPFVYQGHTNFTVVSLAPAQGLPGTYLLRTLVSMVDDSTQAVRPVAFYRVYAVREDGRWVFGNALPRLTRDWRRERFGPITFVWPPTRQVDRRRLAATAAFADSLSRAVGLGAPAPIDYLFTDDMLETFRALGIDYFPTGADTVGGRAMVPNRLVLVGASTAGERYRHEVAHVILQPLLGRGAHRLVVEGLMTWVGGSAGLGYTELLPGLRDYLAAHPALTLEALLRDPPQRVGTLDVGYDGLAVLCAMLHEHGGVAALRRLARAGSEPTAIVAAAAAILGVRPAELDARWRERIVRGPGAT